MNDELEDLLAAERDIDAPSAAERDRMATRLAPLLLPIAAAPTPDLGTTAASAGTTSAAKLVIVSLISAAVGAGGGAAGHAYYASKQPTPVLAAPVAPPPAATLAPVEPELVAPAESVAVPAPSVSARVEELPKPASSLRAERLLLETASAALMKGDHASAIAALKQHQARFPKGELAQEREVLLVQALKASGDSAAADKRAKDFKKKFPGSLQQDSVDKASKPK